MQVAVSSGAQERSWSRASSSASSSSSSDVDTSQLQSVRSSLSGSRPLGGGGSVSAPGLTKKVSFADDLGMLLEQICFFHESSDTPPNLSPRVLRRYASVDNLSTAAAAASNSLVPLTFERRLAQRRSSSMPSLHHGGSGVVTIPRLIPNFSMPVANRAVFHNRISRACVSLESVRVLPVEILPAAINSGSPPVIDRLVGSVAVLNLAFEKSVTARVTFDGWVSYVNARAVYARSERVPSRPGHAAIEFDVFDFSVNLPVRWRKLRGDQPRVELAIRYDVNGQTFWDNNDGQNYELVGTLNSSARSRLRDDNVVPCWTEFSGWNNVDRSCPYW